MTAFATRNPAFSPTELAAFAAQHFGKHGTLRPLPSKRDQNARLVCGDGDYVLKIANPAEDPGQIDLQNATMLHLARVGQAGIPRVVPTLAGADRASVSVQGQPAALRLVTWVSGTPLAEAPRSLDQLANLGRFMGGITRALQGFGHLGGSLPGFCTPGQNIKAGDKIAHLGDWNEIRSLVPSCCPCPFHRRSGRRP